MRTYTLSEYAQLPICPICGHTIWPEDVVCKRYHARPQQKQEVIPPGRWPLDILTGRITPIEQEQ